VTSARLREVRGLLGLSWAALARAMGRADDRALRRWASGRQAIPEADAAWLEACAAAGRVLPRRPSAE
jgi:transcriptional regulator with XRE-family HTH domain